MGRSKPATLANSGSACSGFQSPERRYSRAGPRGSAARRYGRARPRGFEPGGRAAVAAPAALAADEDLGVVGPQRALGVGDFGAQHQHGRLDLVVQGGDPVGRGGRARRRDGPVDLQALAAVQDAGEVDLDAGHGQSADHSGRAGARDGGEAGQHVQPGLQGVAQFVGVGGGAAPVGIGGGADAEVVELDVLGVPGDLAGPGLGGEGLGCVDGHTAPEGGGVKTPVRPSAPSAAPRSSRAVLERVPVRRPLYSRALRSCEGS